MKNHLLASISLSVILCMGSNAAAQTSESAMPSASMTPANANQVGTQFAKFAPRPSGDQTKIDYAIWDEALKFFVLRMGHSLRQGASRPDAGMGTRRVYGHDSRYRLEGNRIAFSYLDGDVVASLTEYRQDLERTADLVDIATLSRNEQLAYWINLHNVAVIEQIALAYPVTQPARMEIGETGLQLDEAPFITVAGVRMSPRDIRTKIVYPHWQDARVVYGFFRGDIGGPSIAREAYTGLNVSDNLKRSGNEFVNSLRGVEKRGRKLLISKIYQEAQPFYFSEWPMSMQAHLRVFAGEEVTGLIDRTTEVRAELYELDIADLANGESEPSYSFVEIDYGDGRGTRSSSARVPYSIARLMRERAQKMNETLQRGERTGTVTIREIKLPGDGPASDEVE